MSVSLLAMAIAIVASPAILVIREAVGRENFDAWLNSDNIKIKTNFGNEEERDIIVIKAGYDMASFLGTPKTHYDIQNDTYFLWEKHNEKIIAVFNRHDDANAIKKFILDVETTAGRKVFSEKYENDIKTDLKLDKQQEYNIQTVFNDKTILLKTLNLYGGSSISCEDDIIIAKFNEGIFKFVRNNDSPYFLSIKWNNELESAIKCLKEINSEYGMQTQEAVYTKLKEKCTEEGYEITDEEVMEDNSIVLTVTMN